ncbi:PREDICTED: uncharacterized protein LOC109231684 [Nicotiana attenuata]|uniref:uncharacterized protein LOC109231684 n=1 Tax=Nicotiana attenuata TaxID=49451 RepID=UPI0009050BA2|nr:PREDICTED: uncharacterized protein LOC109231684 [Nicotiana attenuata]
MEYTFLTSRVNTYNKKLSINVKWRPPPRGWYKINIDGAFRSDYLEGGISGVIHDYKGQWRTGYHKKIHAISPIQAELQAFWHALQLIIREQIFPVEVETDATEVIRFLQDDYPTYNNLICECRWLINKASVQWKITLKHSFREGNMVAHLLAKAALMQSSYNKLCVLVLPPEFVIDVYDKDQNGYIYVRSCSRDHCGHMAALGNDNALHGIILAQNGIYNNDNIKGHAP